MAKFEFSMTIDGVERIKMVEIPDEELAGTHYFGSEHLQMFRRNKIITKMNAWALDKLELSYTEVEEHGKNHADQPGA